MSEFNKPLQNYRPEGLPETPYLLAKQEWDNRIGTARVQAANWRLCALGLLCLCFILTFGMINANQKSKITPYVVRVGQDGAAQAVGPAMEMNYLPQVPEIKYFLAQFVKKTRSLPLDYVIAQQNWHSAYMYLTQAAAIKMNAMVNKANPFQNIGSKTVQVEMNVIVSLSKDSYQVRWKETVFEKEGAPVDSYRMTGLFTICFIEPKTEKEVMENPLGIYIKDFSWDKELDKGE